MAGLIGIFGGTFDPPHLAHLVLADEGQAALDLERVLWVVTADPPHKPDQPLTPQEHRVEMVRRAIQEDPIFELSLIEIDRPGPQYAVDTLRTLNKEFPERLVYLMGEDSLGDLLSWHEPLQFFDLCKKIGVMQRSEFKIQLGPLEDQLPGLMDKVVFFDAPRMNISSSMIRNRVRLGQPYRYLLPELVVDYVVDNKLYLE